MVKNSFFFKKEDCAKEKETNCFTNQATDVAF